MAEASDKRGGLGAAMFRDTALRKMSSADDLDRYVKVTNPSAWVLIGAIAVLLVAAFIWGCTASLPVTQSTTGILKDGQVVCFLPLGEDPIATTDSKVTAAGRDARIVSVNDNPHSQREVAAALNNDFAVESLQLTQWSYKIVIALPDDLSSWEEGDDVPVQVTTREVAPLAYLFGGAQA
ncbi:MAG: hypothetical protein IJ087_22005 [Eggerthellaceae bacterium]|nr:hypothetical protein [Eggerthellaceae bacterium]